MDCAFGAERLLKGCIFAFNFEESFPNGSIVLGQVFVVGNNYP